MYHPIDIHVGKSVRFKRKMLGLTQRELGDIVDLSFQQVQKYEKGENLYIRRKFTSLPGNASGFWRYQLESAQSKHTYIMSGNKASTYIHSDIFNIE